MLSNQLLDQTTLDRFQRDGFVKGPKVIDDAWLGELREELARVIADQGKAGVPQPLGITNLSGDADHPVWQIVNIWEASDAFQRLLNIPGLGQAIQRMIGGDEIRLWHDQIQYKPSGVGGVNAWHQDWPYWPTMSAPSAVTAWFALDDATAENGCMSMVPGSHKWGNAIDHLHAIRDSLVGNFSNLPRDYQGHEVAVQLTPVRAGEVHFHHSLTWHGSNANTSQRPRRAIALHFMNEQVLKTTGGHCCSKYAEGAVGEPLRGKMLPLIWKGGSPVTAQPVRALQPVGA
jgi:phytanoyl-CoA hydroxylase